MRKKELIERIEKLEKEVRILKDGEYHSAHNKAKHRLEIMAEVNKAINESSNYAFDLGRVLSIYKDVLFKAGILTNCEADRSEYQWDEPQKDLLGRNFHFKVNKVAIEKELR